MVWGARARARGSLRGGGWEDSAMKGVRLLYCILVKSRSDYDCAICNKSSQTVSSSKFTYASCATRPLKPSTYFPSIYSAHLVTYGN